MYELKKWKGIYEEICLDRALVLWKKNLQGRGLTKVEKHWAIPYSCVFQISLIVDPLFGFEK